VAAFLNEAYAQEDPLQDLLRTHRRLALMRAPLKARIGVMRKLAAQDSNNPIWTEDVRAFEKARFRQIQVEAAEAAKRHDVDGLGSLLGELEDQTWTEPPPQALLQGLRKADAQFRGEQNRAILTDLEGQLNDAFASSDPVRGRLARDRWLAMLDSLKLSPRDPIHARVEQALLWLERQDLREESDRKHEAATQSLLRALDDPRRIGPVALERMGNAVLGHERGMSDAIQKRYLERLWKEQAAAVRRRQVIVASSISAGVLVLTMIFLGVRRQARLNDAGQAATAVSDMLELGELEQASEFLKKLEAADAGLLEYPSMVDARSRFQAAQDKEVERALKFDQAMRDAQHAPVTEPKPAALQTARSLARLATEKTAVEQLVQGRQAAFLENRARLDKEMAPRLDAVSIEIAKMKTILESAKPGNTDVASLPESIVRVQRQLESMGPDLAHVGDDLQSLSRALAQKLDSIRADLTQRERRLQLEDQITRAVEYSAAEETRDLDPYADLLRQYIKAVPDVPRSRAFGQLDRERSAWKSVVEWNHLASAWRTEANGLTAQTLRDRLERTTKFLAENPWFPAFDQVVEYQKHLEALSRRDLKADAPGRRLVQLLSDPFVESIWMVRVKDSKAKSKCYYLNQPFRGESNLIRYVGGYDGRERPKAIVKANIEYSGWSPQTRIATQYKAILGQEATFTNWDKVMIDLLTAIRSSRDMDHLLQVALLKKVVENAMEGSEPLRAALAPAKGILEQAEFDANVPWMDPDNSDADRLRPRALEIVKSLPDFAEALKEARGHRERIEQVVRRLPCTVGWLIKEDNRWQARTGQLTPKEGDLWVIVPEGNSRSAWRQVGAIKNGTIKLVTESSDVMVEGRPVFMMIQSTSRS
jgi:hypothetical protein